MLMTTIFVVCGKVNYSNLSRYSDYTERTYRRHFDQGIGFEWLNQRLIEQARTAEGTQIGVVDCNFVEKSGGQTYGLDWFYNGKTQRAERGLELSVVGIVDLKQNTAYTLSAQQTAPGLSQSSQPTTDTPSAKGNRIDFYLVELGAN